MPAEAAEFTASTRPDISKIRKAGRYARRIGIAGLATLAAASPAQARNKEPFNQSAPVAAKPAKAPKPSGHSRQEAILAQQYGVSIGTITGEDLVSPKTLPGYDKNKPVTAKRKNQLVASTLALLRRYRGTSGPWQDDGTATKVTDGNKPYAMAAAHEFTFGFQGVPDRDAVDISFVDPYEYAIADPSTPPERRHAGAIIGKITGVGYIQASKSFGRGPDEVVMQVDSSVSAMPGRFENMPGLPTFQHTDREPVPGEQVIGYGVPTSTTDLPVMGKGIYIGTTELPILTGSYQQMDVIGLTNVTNGADDGCEHGESGGSVITRSSYVSGSLSMRSGYSSETNIPPGSMDNPPDSTLIRLQMEDKLKVNLGRFPVVCTYVHNQPGQIETMASGIGVSPFQDGLGK